MRRTAAADLLQGSGFLEYLNRRRKTEDKKKGGCYGSICELDQVTKTYQMGEVTIKAADGISFQVEKGEFVVVVGPSGAGKTTVLNILGGMDSATTGKVSVDGTRVDQLKGKKIIQYRREDIGFVFQFYNLMQNLTALENVELALQICKDPLDAKTVLRGSGAGGAHVTISRHSFPAGSSRGWQLPEHWQKIPSCCSVMSRPVHWTM